MLSVLSVSSRIAPVLFVPLTQILTYHSERVAVTDVEYNGCLATLRRDLITATAAISALSSGLMGIFANLPVGESQVSM